MSKYLEEREYLPIAKSLLIGETVKVVHKGCGARPALHIANEADRWWAYCHKCGRPGSTSKTLQGLKVKAPAKTGWVPKELFPASAHIAALTAERMPDWVWGNLSVLKYSPDTQRLYLPDQSDSLWGYDATGAAIAKLYSPYKRPMASWVEGGAVVQVTSSISRYLAAVRVGCSSLLVGGAAAYDPVISLVSKTDYINYVLDKRDAWHPKFVINMKQFGAVVR